MEEQEEEDVNYSETSNLNSLHPVVMFHQIARVADFLPPRDVVLEVRDSSRIHFPDIVERSHRCEGIF